MKLFKQKYFYIVLLLLLIICGLLIHINKQNNRENRLIEEVEYYDSLNNYNKLYYSKSFKELKKDNKKLYDSLKFCKDKIDYIVQFYHEKEYNTGKVDIKPKDSIVHDTVCNDGQLIAKTYEYHNEPNDTFQYSLKVNSYTEPNWYSINAKVKNKFTIVNKEEGGVNHITIEPDNGGNISDATAFKKKKETFWNRFSVGPGVTAGYDPINKQWGVNIGFTMSYKIN